jgi:hypothetical protein
MLRTFFIASLAAAGVLASHLANAAGSEGLKRPLRTAADSHVYVVQPPLAVLHDTSSAKHSLVA